MRQVRRQKKFIIIQWACSPDRARIYKKKLRRKKMIKIAVASENEMVTEHSATA